MTFRPTRYIPGETWPWDNCPAFVQRAMLSTAQVYLYYEHMLWRVEKHGANGMAAFVGWIHPGLNRPDYEACDPINCATVAYLPGDTGVSPPGVNPLTPESGKPTA